MKKLEKEKYREEYIKYIILRDIFLFFAAFYALIFEDISFGTSCMLILAVATDLGYNLYTTKFNIPK